MAGSAAGRFGAAGRAALAVGLAGAVFTTDSTAVPIDLAESGGTQHLVSVIPALPVARVDSRDAWRAITPSLPASALERRRAGLLIPLRWPAQWKAGSSIVEELKIALTFKQGTSHARIDRLALCPANNAPPAGVRRAPIAAVAEHASR